MSVNGRTAIVTGAGSGLGEAAARRLAGEGARLVVADRNPDAVERVAKEIRAAGHEAVPFVADISVFEQARELVEFAVSSYGGLDLAFNNAGITPRLVDVHEIEPQDWLDVIRVNLTGVFFCMKAELSHFVDHGGGAIVNMASTAGVMAHAGRAAYSASKHGIVGLTRSAAVEYARRGIRINAVAPGPIDAPSAQGLPPEIRAQIAAKTAMNRPGTMEEVAGVVHFLLSDEAAFVTGSVYEANGGQTQL
ncbi:SDR family oxidoreductase [Streptomyces sp. NBC_01622]|uniref:SDR family NAD(P)-dependent oxidoreductase n=1 Tax=Streptomyces sp. NBC_01622 TaxID=2975903 RepID=UPI00386BD252|nr:SDR family oxidoreductase [Streptomyces sp. NBC_01622]